MFDSVVHLLPLLHGDPRLLAGPLWTNWRVDPTVTIGLLALFTGYMWLTGPRNRHQIPAGQQPVTGGQRAAFVAGIASLAIALGPPLEDWAELLLTGHMVQHLMLTMLAPPLLLIGTPAWLLRPILRWKGVRAVGAVLTRPVAAFVVSSAVLIAWHVPALYEASLESEPVHVLQHMMLLITAVIAWLPVLSPLPEWPRLSPLAQCLYLVAVTLPGGVVGSFITFAEPGLYEPYREVPRMWGIGLAHDQEAGGALMWVGTSVAYLLILTIIFFRWAAAEDAKERAPRTPSGD